MVNLKKNYTRTVCIIGLGFVGLTLAAVMCKKGFRVHGVDKKKFIINKLKKKQSHFFEPNLNNTLKEIIKNKKFKFTSTIPLDKNINTYIITVGTPINSKKKIITSYIKQTCLEISKILKDNDTIILRSTVKIGTTRNLAYQIFKKTNKKFFLAYCPERAVEGAALKELCYLPQVIGGINKSSTLNVLKIFKRITKTTIIASSVEAAEMIKLIDNSSRDVFFAYANEIARVCDKMGLNANEIINSGKLGYQRTAIAKPGLVGGPCLEKDPYIFSESFKKFNIIPEITLIARKINERQPSEIVSFILKKINKNELKRKKINISILGLAFKGNPVTDDLRGSMSLVIINQIKKKIKNAKFYGFDPVVEKVNIKNKGIIPLKNIESAFKNKDLIVITNNHNFFLNMKLDKLTKKTNKNCIIYDVWNLFDKNRLKLNNNNKYYSLGNHSK